MTFASPQEKRQFTRAVFARLAARYERVNVVMSLGRVRAWRRLAAVATQLPPHGLVLDVAVGSGGMSAALLQQYPGARVVGSDLVAEMMHVGREQPALQAVRWAQSDGLRLSFPTATFDAVVSGFMLRNVTDVEAALAEQVRVVRPGGRVVCLEMTWPRFWGARVHFATVMPVLGWLLTGDWESYRYLPHSVRAFLSPDELAATMERVGLRDVSYRLLMMGSVTLHVGTRRLER